MPQVFQVLRCYKCMVFQVHQTKKSNKWECKLCGEKQSTKRHYGLGSGKECRLQVQKLNGIRGEIDDLKKSNITDDKFENVYGNKSKQNIGSDQIRKESKWSEFAEKTEEAVESNCTQSMYLDNTEVVLDMSSKHKKLCDTNLSNTLVISSPHPHKVTKGNIVSKTKTNKPDDPGRIGHNVLDAPEHNILKTNSLSSFRIKKDICITENIEPHSINSKWNQFTYTSEIHTAEVNDSSKENTAQKVPHNLFSLCDDYDLDDVLNI